MKDILRNMLLELAEIVKVVIFFGAFGFVTYIVSTNLSKLLLIMGFVDIGFSWLLGILITSIVFSFLIRKKENLIRSINRRRREKKQINKR